METSLKKLDVKFGHELTKIEMSLFDARHPNSLHELLDNLERIKRASDQAIKIAAAQIAIIEHLTD
ncbi:hypothetical protein SEA_PINEAPPLEPIZZA_2 [Microbacterium phage PineapplePizza]|uniref:Uncharacterized protein n=1 Tax=Microbacterium phage PineapplePizza TaxID=2927268 RepID=A0A976U8H9_9CAUD|nr:hypothetical protein QEH41_gp02 [Microbacterium phage PineapplePizza]UVF60410.1 hypothetical protein SEA_PINEAPPLEPIZZA_2 [Microbacterium phage PineapplePizza]